MVRCSDGFQIGIQAKLKLNAEVIAQAIEGDWPRDPGPDCRAVLVPSGETGHFGKIVAYLGITIIQVYPPDHPCNAFGPAFTPSLPNEGHPWTPREWHEQAPTKRHDLPAYVPDVTAGSSAPLQLTKWKIAAIKIAVTLERRGFVTRADFRHHGIDHRRWIAPIPGWLQPGSSGFIAGPGMPDFKAQHPRVYAEIAADAEKWLPPAEKLLARSA